MLKYIIKEFNHKKGKDINGNLEVISRLRSSCERAKRVLSSTCEISIEIKSLFEGIDFFPSISHTKFELLNMDIFIKCMELVQKWLKDAKIKNNNIDEVVLEGGSSKILMDRSCSGGKKFGRPLIQLRHWIMLLQCMLQT